MGAGKLAIEVENLTKSYGKTEVLKGVSFKVERGTMLALLGPNGAGKTTTVRILSTLLSRDGGKVTVEGFDTAKDADKVRSVIGLTGQSAAVDELLTGRENLVMMGRLYRLTRQSAKKRANELLADFDLLTSADRPAKTYSGGMRRRLDLAVSLIAAPPIIFLDEPTTGLDPRSRIAMWEIIRKLMKGGTTILLTTQYLEEADQLADNIVLIDGGKVAAEGTAKQLKNQMGSDRLELVFSNKKPYRAAKNALTGMQLNENEAQLTLVVPVDNPNDDVRAVLEKLNAAKASVDSLALHKPTLDDVFLSITSKQGKGVE
ncbi:ATP-binding cassette domain-containing protein [Candidatus Saccharibacteria bacterium]|nr:ATP-binding cassette domain-containing protein [Candidatus Saccharibacteria bacterium]